MKYRILIAALTLLVACDSATACPRLFGRLRARLAGGGSCNGGQQQQQFQQQGDDQQPGPSPGPGPINDTVSFRHVQYAAAPTQGFVNPIAPPAPMPDTVAQPLVGPPPSVTPKGEVSDDSGTRPGVGIAAVEKRTTALEAQVATLTQQVAQLTAALAPRAAAPAQRSTVYLSGAAADPTTHHHTCGRCGTTWSHGHADGASMSHNCPKCGTFQNVVAGFGPGPDRAAGYQPIRLAQPVPTFTQMPFRGVTRYAPRGGSSPCGPNGCPR